MLSEKLLRKDNFLLIFKFFKNKAQKYVAWIVTELTFD